MAGVRHVISIAVIVLLLCWPVAGLSLTPEQAQAVISKLARQASITRKLVDKIHSGKNWAKDPEFHGYVKLIPPAQLALNLERRALSHDLALCKATERFGIQAEITTSREYCAKVRSAIDDIEPWNREKVIDDADQIEYEALKLYMNPLAP